MVERDQLEKVFSHKRTVIVGVGNLQRGDDIAGSLLAQRLIDLGIPDVIDGADVPENYTGEIKARSPQVIVFLDAVDFGGRVGEVALFKKEQLAHDRFSSHRPALGLVANYLAAETNAEVFLVGIQPQSTQFGTKLSEGVAETVDMLVQMIVDLQKKQLEA